MYTAQQDFLAHLHTAPAADDLKTLKPYAGEVKAAAENPAVLDGKLPAALVMHKDGVLRAKGHYEMDVLVITETPALDQQEGARDALQRAEEVATWLRQNKRWRNEDGTNYVIDISDGGGIRVQRLMTTTSFSVYLISFLIDEL